MQQMNAEGNEQQVMSKRVVTMFEAPDGLILQTKIGHIKCDV
jgi:hypothetical protein